MCRVLCPSVCVRVLGQTKLQVCVCIYCAVSNECLFVCDTVCVCVCVFY